MFDEFVKFCEKDGAFDPTTVGRCPNVDLMASKALWNVSWPCARCVVVCVREVASVEGHDRTCCSCVRRDDVSYGEARRAETDETTSAKVKLARDW